MNIIPNGAVARAARRFNQRVRGTDSYLESVVGMRLCEAAAYHLRKGSDAKNLVVQNASREQARRFRRWLEGHPIQVLIVNKLIVEYENSELCKLVNETRRAYGIDTGGHASGN